MDPIPFGSRMTSSYSSCLITFLTTNHCLLTTILSSLV